MTLHANLKPPVVLAVAVEVTMNKSIANNFLSRPRVARAVLIAAALLAIGLAPSAKADIIFKYIGNPFAYNPEGPPGATAVSGFFILTSPLLPNTTLDFFFAVGAMTASDPQYVNSPVMTGYRFTDGRQVWTPGNNVGPTVSHLILTADANSDLVQWAISLNSADGLIGTEKSVPPPPDPGNAEDQSYETPGGQLLYGVVSNWDDPGNWTLSGTAAMPAAVFRDSLGSIRLSTYASSTLSNSGGLFASDPSAAQDLTGNTFVTARDDYNSVWANVYDPNSSTWSGWQLGGGIIQGVPSIAVDTSGTGWIASRDTWNSYWLVSYTPASGFGSWIPLLGIFSTDPVVTACGDGSIYLIGKDNWNSLWSGQYIPVTGFQGWVFGGGIITGEPAATCGGDNAVYVVGEDSWNSNWMVRVSGNSWGSWYFGGAITSVTPRIVALGNGSEAVVILDPTKVVYSTTYTEGTANGWQPWAEVGGILSDVEPAVVGGGLYLVGQSPTGDLWWWQQAGNQWTWIGNNGVAAGALAAAPK